MSFLSRLFQKVDRRPAGAPLAECVGDAPDAMEIMSALRGFPDITPEVARRAVKAMVVQPPKGTDYSNLL